MSERKSIFLLVAIMIMTCISIAGTTITILYNTAIHEERARLMETAQSQARLIESIARFDGIYSTDYPGGAKAATLNQIIDAHENYIGFGKTGEFTLSEKIEKEIVFLLRHRYSNLKTPKPVPIASELAEPMRRALSGRSGTVVGLDYRGEKVLAAYEPVAELNFGIVAKIDMSEIRAPFLKAGLIGMCFTVLVVLIGVGMFFRVANPMVIQLEKQNHEMKKLNDDMKSEIQERKQATTALRKSERELNLRNRISKIFLTFPDNEMYGEVLIVVLEALKSKYGTFAYIDEGGTRVVPSMTRDVWDKCKIPEKDIFFPRDTWGDNIWARCLIEKNTISSNGPFHVPPGHVPITRTLAIPIIHQGEAIGNFMVGNKLSDYDENDRELIETIADFTAPVLKARLQRDNQERKRKQAEEELQQSYDKLEQRVEKRTAELSKINKELEREIDERRKAEDALRKSEETYRLLVKTLPSIVYLGQKDWYIKLFDDKIELLTGYGAEEFNSQKMKWTDVIHEEDLEAIKESFFKAIKTDRAFVWEYRIKSKSGDIRWIQERAQIVCDSQGEVEYVSGVFFDISDAKKQDEALKKNEMLLNKVFDGISDPLFLLDENMKIKILNKAASRYYQKEKKSIKDVFCHQAFMGKSEPCDGCQVPAALKSRQNLSFERNGIKDPSRLEEVVIYQIDSKDTPFSGAILRIHDITNARLMDRQIVHNEKLASLGLMISSIAHEITNPISAITFNAPILKEYSQAMLSIIDGYAKNIQDFELFKMPYVQFKIDVHKIVDNILHASQRVHSTVSDLRKVSAKKKQQEKSWVDLKQLIERVKALVGLEVIQNVTSFKVNIPENLSKLYTDPDAVEQILTNLLINAAHAADKEDSRIKLDIAEGNSWKDYMRIEISDNGCGMDKETLSKIFNPFFSSKNPGKDPGNGTGLGLYISKYLLQGLGGRIEVESEVGKGSLFRVVFSDIEKRSVKRL